MLLFCFVSFRSHKNPITDASYCRQPAAPALSYHGYFFLCWFYYFCRRKSEVKKESLFMTIFLEIEDQHKVPSVLISCVTLVSLVTWLLIPCLLCFIFTPLKYLIANLYEFHVDLIFQFFTDSLWCQHWSFLIIVSHLSTSWGLEVSRRVDTRRILLVGGGIISEAALAPMRRDAVSLMTLTLS